VAGELDFCLRQRPALAVALPALQLAFVEKSHDSDALQQIERSRTGAKGFRG
jgi:hypothetical protein